MSDRQFAFGRYNRSRTPDVVLDAMRAELYDLLTPERYDRGEVMKLETKIRNRLEFLNHIERVNDAGLTVAGYEQDVRLMWAA